MSSLKLFGKKHNQLLRFFTDEWLHEGSPVCFLEGFPGVGKTKVSDLLAVHLEKQKQKPVIIRLGESSDPFESLFTELARELNDVWGMSELAKMYDNRGAWPAEIAKILNWPIVIIVDEFQNAMHGEIAKPIGEIGQLFTILAKRPNIPGRLLLLTNRIVERERWSETFNFKMLAGMDTEDGLELFNQILSDLNTGEHLEESLRLKIVGWLGGNPRALNLLAKNIDIAPIDELFDVEEQSSEVRGHIISQEIISDFERRLLLRILNPMPMVYAENLYKLTVFRKPVRAEIIDNLFNDPADASRFLAEALNQFLLERSRGYIFPHPIVKEIGLQKMSTNPGLFKASHAFAGRQFARFFLAKDKTAHLGTLGNHFAEARFHFVKAGMDSELAEITARFSSHLSLSINAVSKVPSNREALDERIAVLTELLKVKNQKGLAFHLAKCLQSRGLGGDIPRAIQYAQNNLGNENSETWILLAQMLSSTGQNDKAITLLKRGVGTIPAGKNLFSLYALCAELLSRENREAEAIELLQHGISKIPADKGLVSIYSFCARLMSHNNRSTEAIELLRQGIAIIPADKNLFSLISLCAELLSLESRDSEAIELLKNGISEIPPDKGVVSLYSFCAELMSRANRSTEAIELLKKGIGIIPADKNLFSLISLCAEMMSRVHRSAEAIELIKQGLLKIPADKGLVALYSLCAELMSRDNKVAEAVELLKYGISIIPADKSLSSLYTLCAELLSRVDRNHEAIELLKHGIAIIPADKNLFSLISLCAELLSHENRSTEAIELLREGIQIIPDQYGAFVLITAITTLLTGKQDRITLESLLNPQQSRLSLDRMVRFFGAQLDHDWQEAIRVISNFEGQKKVFSLCQEAYCNLITGKAAQTISLLSSIPEDKISDRNIAVDWLFACAHLHLGELSLSQNYYRKFGMDDDSSREALHAALLRFWDKKGMIGGQSDLAVWFPVLPPSISGLKETYYRYQYSESVLPRPIPTGLLPPHLQEHAEPVAGEIPPPLTTIPTGEMKKVFISYAQAPGTDVGDRVLELADKLRSEGVETMIDQYIHGSPPNGWRLWMKEQIEQADFVICVFTELYFNRWEGQAPPQTGLGSTREAILLDQILYEQGHFRLKVIPVIFDNGSRQFIPFTLRDIQSYELMKEYDELYFYITGQPKYIPAPIGSIRKR